MIDGAKEANEKKMEELDATRTDLLRSVGNQLHHTVPVFQDEVGLAQTASAWGCTDNPRGSQ